METFYIFVEAFPLEMSNAAQKQNKDFYSSLRVLLVLLQKLLLFWLYDNL